MPSVVMRTAVAALAVAALAVAVLAVALLGRGDESTGPPLGAVLDDADRRVLAAGPAAARGTSPAGDPSVDLADPAAVARAYLAAARSSGADDGGRTHLRAAAYAVPGSPPAAVGVVVLDPPPPGRVRTATVTGLELVTADEASGRRGYQATVATTTGPPGGPAPSPVVTSASVVLARQPDGRWLVALDTPDPDFLDADD